MISCRNLTIAAALLLPLSAIAADLTVGSIKAQINHSQSCAKGLKTLLANYDATKASDALKQAILTGDKLDMLNSADRTSYEALLNSAKACDMAHASFISILKDVAEHAKARKPGTAELKAEFEKLDAEMKAANEAIVAAAKVTDIGVMLSRIMKAPQ